MRKPRIVMQCYVRTSALHARSCAQALCAAL